MLLGSTYGLRARKSTVSGPHPAAPATNDTGHKFRPQRLIGVFSPQIALSKPSGNSVEDAKKEGAMQKDEDARHKRVRAPFPARLATAEALGQCCRVAVWCMPSGVVFVPWLGPPGRPPFPTGGGGCISRTVARQLETASAFRPRARQTHSGLRVVRCSCASPCPSAPTATRESIVGFSLQAVFRWQLAYTLVTNAGKIAHPEKVTFVFFF